MNKITLGVVIALILGFIGLVTWSMSQNLRIDYDSYDWTRIIEASEDNGNIGDHFRGNHEALVTVVEWGDFSCSHCAAIQSVVNKMVDEFGDRVVFIYRNFPLSGYPNSIAAASIVEAAGLQGHYDVAATAMFANQSLWMSASESTRMDIFINSVILPNIPDIDLDQLRTDMNSREIARKIDFDKNLGKRRNISGTPSFFINGEKVDGDVFGSEDSFRAYLNQLLKDLGVQTGTQTQE